MKRKLIITVIIMLSVFLISVSAVTALASGKRKEKAILYVNGHYDDRAEINEIQPSGYQLIVGDDSNGVFVYGKKISSLPYYERVLVKTKSAQREFNWKATNRNPRLMISDVTGTGEKSAVIIFVTAAGTGYLQSDVHIVNMVLTREIPVQDPALSAKRLITSGIQGNEVVFKAGGAEYRVKPSTSSGKLGSEYNNLLYGSIINYSVENNRLKADVTVQTFLGSFLGEFTLTYSYTGGRLVPKVTGFKAI